MPSQASNRLAFPLLQAENGFWSGLALVNSGGQETSAMLVFYDDGGRLLSSESIDLAPRRKVLRTAPLRAAHAMVNGDNLIGFCLIGANDGRLGGYLALDY